MKLCSIEGCGKKHEAKGVCAFHYRRQHYTRNKERINQKNREFYAKNREKADARHREYVAENREEIKQYKKSYREQNIAHIQKQLYSTKGRFQHLRGLAKKRGLEVLMTFEQYEQLIAKGSCDYCSGPLSKTGGGLDRLDNNKGYVIENVVPCCGNCNKLRQNLLAPEETKALVQQLKQLRNTEGSPWEQANDEAS